MRVRNAGLLVRDGGTRFAVHAFGALLLAIFAAAAASAEPATRNHGALLTGAEIRQQESGRGDGEPDSGDDEREELGDLQRQLLNAYIPGNSFDSVGGIGIVSTIKIIPGETNGGNGP